MTIGNLKMTIGEIRGPVKIAILRRIKRRTSLQNLVHGGEKPEKKKM